MRVVLVHGLARSRLSMIWLGQRLRCAGCDVEYFSYSTVRDKHPRVLTQLVDRLTQIAKCHQEVVLVGHSFGGLLLREAAARVPDLKVRRIFMLGTPNQPPRMAEHLFPRLRFRFLMEGIASRLRDSSWYRTLPRIAAPYTIVSGTRGWYGRRSPFASDLNDGIVSVSETIVERSDHPVLVRSFHSFLMNKRKVVEMILRETTPVNER